MSELQQWQWQAELWMMSDYYTKLRATSWMWWNSHQPVHTMEDVRHNFMHVHGAAEHMTASTSAERERDDDGEFAGDDLDIAAELKRIASVALAVSKEIIQSANVLQLILAPFEETLINLEQTPADILAMPTVHDDFEVRGAQALFQVDELLQEQTPPLPVGAVRRLHAMQVLTQDLVILACSRHIKQTILRNRNFPPELLTRLQAAFTVTALADESLKSRLGNSKHHVWTVDKHRKNHKHRPARSGRGNRRHLNASISDEDSSTATTETASAAPAGSSPAKFPRPPEILSPTALKGAARETSAAAACSDVNKSCHGNPGLQDTVKHYENEDGGCFRAPDTFVAVMDSISLETIAAAPIVDTTDKSDSEYFELMLEELLANHGVYTSDLKCDIMRWQQQQVSIYSRTFSF